MTGATGFVGRHVLAQISQDSSLKVYAVSRQGPFANAPTSVQWLNWDFTSQQSIEAVVNQVQPHRCLHLAWNTETGRYLDDACLNVALMDGSVHLLDSLTKAACEQVIMLGTCAEYAVSSQPLTEQSPKSPETAYAVIKSALSQLGPLMTKNTGTKFCWARLFHLYGPGEDSRRFVPSILTALFSELELKTSDCLQIRDYLHVGDVARAIVCLMRSGVAGEYNICSGEPVTLKDIIRTAERIYGKESKIAIGALPRRPWDPSHLVGDSTRLRGLGWKPLISLENGLLSAMQGSK